ncbi:hypothetical protein G6F43_007386 [Rhizopus delemar]|nr:hypothetical protein G6F43_007386 [Rhizopus delemar]
MSGWCKQTGFAGRKPSPLTVSAYGFQDSSRAFASIKMSPTEVRPLPIINEQNEIVLSEGPRVNDSLFPPEREYKKLKYFLYKYAFENINNGKIVNQIKLSYESFALYLYDLHEELVEKEKIISNEFNPVRIVETVERQRGAGTGRPEKRRMTTHYSYNSSVRKTDFALPAFSLENLLDEELPFDAVSLVSPTYSSSSSNNNNNNNNNSSSSSRNMETE